MKRLPKIGDAKLLGLTRSWTRHVPTMSVRPSPRGCGFSAHTKLQCIRELRDKANHFRRTGIIRTLDADASIAKSDSIVPAELHDALRDAFARLKADNSSNPDWHPRTGEKVQDLVHPSMYPLVYGRSLFIPEEVVGVEDAIDKWAGKGEVIPRRPEWGEEGEGKNMRRAVLRVPNFYWSTTYQWLPANLKFTDDGGVRFTSYINNLHPNKYQDIYRTIEELIKVALPMWDDCFESSGRRIDVNFSGGVRYVCRFLVGEIHVR